MNPHALLELATELLHRVLQFKQPADGIVSDFFREHRALGQRERHTLAETTYTVLRERALLLHLAQSGRGEIERRLAILGWQGNEAFLRAALVDGEPAWLARVAAIARTSLPDKLRHNLCFTPDLLSIILVVATQANGDVLIHQKMFESRLFFVDKLIDMGAKIMLCDPHRAVVMGHNFQSQLKATVMSSPDIRAGISLLIAALSAKGTSTIQNIEQIDRGYERIDERLRALGANIVRV